MAASFPVRPPFSLFDPFEGMQFGPRHCFLCGAPTTPPTDTVPVFGEWLMRHYQLADQPILMLDQSTRTYQDLRVPCCSHCRTQHVEPLENKVEQAADLGAAGLRALDEKTLFLWLGKMWYGILLTELLNEMDPLVKPLYPLAENAQLLRRLQAFYQSFQALRVPIEFADFSPASIFILDTAPAEDTIPFEYDDDLSTVVFSLKLNETVLTTCLVDNGLIAQAMSRVYADAQRPLHPVQVAEFKARVYYAAYLLNVVPDYYPRPLRPGDDHLVLDALIDDITDVLFNRWENSAYAQALEQVWRRWQIPHSQIMANPAEPLSLLYDSESQPRTILSYPLPG